jgi:hypothetical protein
VPHEAPDVAVECRFATVLVERNRLDSECVAVGRKGESSLEVSRRPAAIVLELDEAASPDALVHPLLTAPISILARWRGDLTFHAGAFLAGGRAWAVMGGRESGKSTTLAALAERGHSLLGDDLLVLDEGEVRAGPACVDLRPDVARRVPGARYVGEVGGRHRHRLAARPGPARATLGGVFLMEWSEQRALEVERLSPTAALEALCAQEYIGLMGPVDPEKILDLLELPIWRVTRPADWALAEEVVDRILELANAQDVVFPSTHSKEIRHP